MKLYSVYDGEDFEYYVTLKEAKRRATELAKYDARDTYEGMNAMCNVDEVHIARVSRSLVLDIINRRGFVDSREVIYTATFPGIKK